MRSDVRLSLLIIENDVISRDILLNHIGLMFPSIVGNSTSTSREALELLKENKYDIVVCGSLLAREEQIRFTWQVCAETEPIVIVITADTDIKLESFPSNIQDVCVQHVAHKPVDLRDLMQSIAAAIERVRTREKSNFV